MKMRIKEFAELTGVSVRTLHYYDEIGLLCPAFIDEQTGYRFYNEDSLMRMQEILFYRELDFSLKGIGRILSSPDYDKEKALSEQRRLLKLKKERIERLISAIDDAAKGKTVMKAFDNSEYENYKQEVKERWGGTNAYREHAEKTKHYSGKEWSALYEEMGRLFAAFSECRRHGAAPDSSEAQKLVKTLQDHITENYYHCTDEILAGLGNMYVSDERFQAFIDQSGDGTAQYVCQAIEVYCGKENG